MILVAFSAVFLLLSSSVDHGSAFIGSGQPLFCEAERDKYRVLWPTTGVGIDAVRPCPFRFEGYAFRYCFEDGVWDNAYYLECQAKTIRGLGEFVEYLYYSDNIDINGTEYAILQLVRLTQPPSDSVNEPFLSSDDLDIIIYTIEILGDFLFETTTFSELDEDIFVDSVHSLLSNILDVRNEPSWDALIDFYDITGADILQFTERYAKFIAMGIQQQIVQFSGLNLGLTVEKVPIVDDAVFPKVTNLANTSNVNTSTIRISRQYLEEVASEVGSTTDELPIAFLIFPTVQDFLPLNSTDENITVGSVVLSAQFGTGQASPIRFDDQLIELNFTIKIPDNASNISATCVYWNFSSSSSGTWLSDGIVTEIIDNNTVRCLSSHLTSFAVLVDVSGVLSRNTNSTAAPPQLKALSYVSYIGTGLSVVCLIFTIIYLLTYGKELFEKVHYFLHLNLSIALLVGFIVFIGGVSHASTYRVSCKIIAILLHYFFLSAFCWMLCEAILLYFLVVIVFTNITERWYVFLVIGWFVPLVYVLVIFGAFNDSYITDSAKICWLNYSNHVIWSFTAPMCLIIIVNTVVIIITVVVLYKTKRRQLHMKTFQPGSKRSIKPQDKATILTIIKGIVFLLPLLGITWIVGLFALDTNALFFAWLFTMLNSLQGVFLFVFHVVLSKKVSDTVKRLFLKEGRVPSTVISSLHGPTKSEEAKNSTMNCTTEEPDSKLGLMMVTR